MYDGKWEDGKYNPYPTKGYAIRHDIGGKGAGDYCQHFDHRYERTVDGLANNGNYIARQMRDGTGKYNKEKGRWE